MKKAEEYYYEAAKNYNHNKNEVDILVINTIRKAQMDAIDKCIKSLKIDYPDGYEKTLNNILKLKEEL